MYEELIKKLRNRRICIQNGGDLETDFPIMKEAADAIEELQAAVDGYEANIDVEFVKEDGHERIRFVPKWISVKERLPEHLTSVIVHRKDGGIFMWEYFNTSPTDECWIDDSMNVYSFYDVTHWMPLPEPPEEET